MQSSLDTASPLGVIVVLFRSEDVIGACLESLLKSRPALGRIVLVDNASPDGSVEVVREVARAHGVPVREAVDAPASVQRDGPGIEIIRSAENLGFAGGVNLGLAQLHADPAMRFYWVLNPDCELTPGCADTLLGAARDAERRGGFALIGTRILYHGENGAVQSDGGLCCRWTGRCRNLHQGLSPIEATGRPLHEIDFVSGASMVASQAFVDRVGMLPESYFLYYEEVDWAAQRGALPLFMCKEAVVRHHGGTAIGSGSVSRAPSPLSAYFNFRNRLRFIRRHNPIALPFSYGFSLLKLLQMTLRGHLSPAWAGFRGLHCLAPSRDVASALDARDHARAFSRENHAATPKVTPPLKRSPA